MKILIAEDDPKYARTYKTWATELGHEVREATSVAGGLESAMQERPDAVITDFGLKDGNGNTLAAKIKDAYNGIRIAGITGGEAKNFDRRYIDIAETKQISRAKFSELVDCLATGRQYTSEEQSHYGNEIVLAANILFQGYVFSKALQEGHEEVAGDGEVLMSKDDLQRVIASGTISRKLTAAPKTVFSMFDEGELDVTAVYNQACKMHPELERDARFKGIFDKLGRKDYDFSIDDAVYATKKLRE